MKRALVLSGGGALGAYQVGMINELVGNQGLDFQILRGVSVGALNAAYLAQASTRIHGVGDLACAALDLLNLWQGDIKGNSSVYKKRLGLPGMALGADSLYSMGPLEGLIAYYLSFESIYSSGRDVAVGVVSLVTGEYKEATGTSPLFPIYLRASMSIPGYFPPRYDGLTKDVYVDGGVRNITPLASAFRAGADEIYVLLASKTVRRGDNLPTSRVRTIPYEEWQPGFLGIRPNAIDVIIRSIGILADEIFLDDIRGALKINQLFSDLANCAGLTDEWSPYLQTKRPVPIYVLAPQEDYGDKDDCLDFSPKLIKRAIEHGHEIASDPKKWVWPIREIAMGRDMPGLSL